MPNLKAKDFDCKEKPFCEHCMKLKPYRASYTDDDGVSWCLRCITGMDDYKTGDMFKVSDIEMKKVEIKEKKLQIKYHEKELKKLKK